MNEAVQRVRETEAYRAAKAQLTDREWRLDHLYSIKQKENEEGEDSGKPIQFVRNHVQRLYSSTMWYRDIILKARQLGFSTDIAIKILDDSLFRTNMASGIIDLTNKEANKKLDKCRFAYVRLPKVIREAVKLTKDNESTLEFSNGSVISAGTGYRGDTPQNLWVSEYGKISSDRPDRAREIKLGAFQAVPMSGKVYAEGTAHGTGGEFYDIVTKARKMDAEGVELTRRDFKLHFFAWWQDPQYRIPVQLVRISAELEVYFQDLRENYGIKLDGPQKAWYAKMLEEIGPDDIKSEYPSHIDEAFFTSLEGGYFRQELAKARLEKRIGQPVPHDPSRPVNTCWDIGMDDENAVWFFQDFGSRVHYIDFAKMSDVGVSWCPKILEEKKNKRGFIYGKHYGPHDLEVRDWSSKTVRPRKEVASDLGVKFIVVPAPDEKADGIEAARQLLGLSYFDVTHTAEGVRALDNYRKSWIQKMATWGSDPVHNWASHPADAYQTGALGLEPDTPRVKRRRSAQRAGSAWSA